MAATDRLVKLIAEREFSVLFHDGQRDHVHVSIVAGRAILVVIFDDRSSLGLVRMRVKRADGDFERIFDEMTPREGGDADGQRSGPFPELTDEDIDALFGE